MSDRHRTSLVGILSSLLAIILLLVLGVGVAAYAMGWMTVDNQAETTTIEVNTGKLREAADKASAEGDELLEKTGDVLKKAGAEIEDAVDRKPTETSTEEQVE